ncbi:MAG: glycosyltransferase family 39 protein [Cyanobacteria bacterium]|nr:glycosyltransferase family 39 protein [Cyanobacteriota bacterium]
MGGWLQRRAGLVIVLVTLLLGWLLFVAQLGKTGLVDETPPLFAASARAMAATGDWLVPQVNGLPRYDKPPLVYWLMALVHRLPGQERWDPLGSWAAGLPSALATVALMLALADTLRRWPQAGVAGGNAGAPRPGLAPGLAPLLPPLVAALAFALSPLVLLWSRIGVSDALFTATLATSLLLCWRTYADPGSRWWSPWPVLALAVLTKGPVALVLMALTLLLFAALQADAATLRRRLRPLTGIALAALLALPWYGLALLREGRPFWDSFFGYHNLQRFTAVVNNHLQPWWFFGPILVLASLPVTPLLLLGLRRALGPWPLRSVPPAVSLHRFAACWLLAVLAFFTIAATKLPSYWLPATPAAALLILLAAGGGSAAPAMGMGGQEGGARVAGRWGLGVSGAGGSRDRALERAWTMSLALCALLGLAYLAGPLWVPLIQDPELATLPAGILASGRLPLAGACYLLAACLGWCWRRGPWPLPLLLLQLPLVAFVPLVLLPLWTLGDQVRGAPVRAMAEAVRHQARPGEPVAMVGILKPSLHYYSRRVVLYEGTPPEGPINLADRLRRERRAGQLPSSAAQQPTVLVVIDGATAALPHWRGLGPTELARSGLYRLWRVDRRRLETRAAELARGGLNSTWWRPRPERY